MTRTIRTLAAKLILCGAASIAPFALPTVAYAQQNAPTNTVPEAKKLSAKEQHQQLLKSSGWIQLRSGEQTLSHGTGWVLDAERRLMVTNDHVVAGQDTVWVVFPKYKDGKLVRQETDYAGEKGVKATVIDRDFVTVHGLSGSG
jgi:S1-C subfamily serine protease